MADKKIHLTVALAVYNEEKNLPRCLASVAGLADEIVIVDGGSTDGTVTVARSFGARVTQTDNPVIFHVNKQKALDMARGAWILQLDADESVDGNLREEIHSVVANKDSRDGYYIPRRNYFLGNWLRKGGQYPDYVIRLFKNGKGSFPQKSVHEQIAIQGETGHLSNPLDHYSYSSVAQYWQKSESYIRLTAGLIRRQKGSKTEIAMTYLFSKPVMTFVLMFFRHKGFVDGWRGFLYALFSALHFPKAYLMSRT